MNTRNPMVDFIDKCRHLAREQGCLYETSLPKDLRIKVGVASGPRGYNNSPGRTFPVERSFIFDDEWMTIVAAKDTDALHITRKPLIGLLPDAGDHLKGSNPMIMIQDDGGVLRTHGEYRYLVGHVDEILGGISDG